MKLNKIIGSLVLAGSLLSGSSVFAADLNAAQKKQVEDIVSSYVSQHPEDIIKSLQSYQQKQMSQTIEKTHSKALKNVDAIFRHKGDPVSGNPKGNVTVVEFFDYQCAHCINMLPVFNELIKKNDNVRMVYKEFPIRGPVSELAAKAALAALQQGKYQQLHDALMKTAAKKALNEKLIFAAAKKAGLNIKKLKSAMKSDSVAKQLKDNYALARNLELMGTPAIFIAESSVSEKSPASAVVFIPGETNTAHLNEVVKQVLKTS